MGILDYFYKASPVRKIEDEPPQAQYSTTYSRLNTITYQNHVSAAEAMKHPVLFRVINKIAESVQGIDWYAEAIPGKKANKEQLATINDLLDSPNDSMTPAQLKYWMALTYATYRRFPIKIGKGVGDKVNAIYPLRSEWVIARTDERGMIVAYDYGEGTSKQSFPSLRKAGPDKPFIYEIFTPSLNASLDGSQSMSPLGTLSLASDIIQMLLQRASDTASGHPNVKYIITAERGLTEDQKRAVTDLLENSGPGDDTSGYTLFLYNTKIEVHKLDNRLDDIHSKVPMDDMIRQLTGSYGVPVSLVGLGGADSAKYAGNYNESRIAFFEDTIIPGYLVPIEDGLTQALCPKNSNIRIRFDRDSIPALTDSRVKTGVELSKVNFLTDDEKREIIDYPETTVVFAKTNTTKEFTNEKA